LSYLTLFWDECKEWINGNAASDKAMRMVLRLPYKETT
jgi:hypothetical protein